MSEINSYNFFPAYGDEHEGHNAYNVQCPNCKQGIICSPFVKEADRICKCGIIWRIDVKAVGERMREIIAAPQVER